MDGSCHGLHPAEAGALVRRTVEGIQGRVPTGLFCIQCVLRNEMVGAEIFRDVQQSVSRTIERFSSLEVCGGPLQRLDLPLEMEFSQILTAALTSPPQP